MTEAELERLKAHETTILDILARTGTTLANVDPGRSLLFLLSTIIPGFAFGILWDKRGGQYQRSCTTTTEDDYRKHVDVIRQCFNVAGFKDLYRGPDVLEATRPIEKRRSSAIKRLEIKTAFGASLVANHLILLLFSDSKLAEIYLKDTISEEQLERVEQASKEICACLDSRLVQIYNVLLAKDESSMDFPEMHGNRRLFRQIFRDMKTWFGEDFRTVNIFTYDPRDRLLYHLETSHLVVDETALKAYEPTPEMADPSIYKHIVENIDGSNLPKGITAEVLKELLVELRDKKKWRKNALKDEAKLLKALLGIMPQEPGTGVAGETALTRIPQLGLDTSDPRWQPRTSAYRGTFFAAMLPIEQIFGIGSSGNKMAAVPLMESGQLWGVLFFVQKEPYTSLRLLALWEKAQHISSVLSLFRSFRFQNAIIRSAGEKPHVPIARLALENIHLALNPIFAVHWQLHHTNGGHDHIECWQFAEQTRRFGLGDAIDPKKRPFNNSVIRSEVHRRIKRRNIEIIEFVESEGEAKTGLPSDLKFPHRELIRAAIMIPVPPYDLLAVYMDEDAKTMTPFLSQFKERFSCLWDVQEIRENKVADRIIITQSKKMELPLTRALKIVQSPEGNNINILLRGEPGTGKELVARSIHMMSGRRGDFVGVNVAAIPHDLMESTLFGHIKGGFTGAHEDRIGLFAKANGGVLFLDEIGDLPYDLQVKLLRVIEERVFTPVGSSEPVEADVILITATNQPLETFVNEKKFRQDLYGRLAVFELELPPLRDRREDITLLARYFLSHLFPTKHLRLSAQAMARLLNDNWPSNVRELRNTIIRSGTYLENGKSVLSLEDVAKKEIQGSAGAVRAENIRSYVGLDEDEDDGCRGWALFSDETYDIDKESPKEDWSHAALSAFSRLKAQNIKVDSYCSVGCGAGLDAIIAANTWMPRRVLLTDVNEDVLAIAQENVNLNASHSNMNSPHLMEVSMNKGNLFQNFPEEEKFDLIYENLPNLPWRRAEPLGGRKWATFCLHANGRSALADRWLLSVHEGFLEQASYHLEPKGRVVCCIGARVPWDKVAEMFEAQGYTPELIYFGIKKQQQPQEVIEGYARAEAEDKGPFIFLDLKMARAITARLKVSDNPDELRRIFETQAFKDARLTATKALEELNKGQEGKIIGHGFYVVSGSPKSVVHS
jgi:transcriptional regulator with AAA-type ATPase domain/methylase of polypeptide subunit release factors